MKQLISLVKFIILFSLTISYVLSQNQGFISKELEPKSYFQTLIEKIDEKIKNLSSESLSATELVKNITSSGFEKFVQTSEYQKIQGLSTDFLEDFLNNFLKNLDFPQDKIQKLKEELMDILKQNTDDIRKFQIIFEDEKTNLLTSCLVVMSLNVKAKELDVTFTSTSTEKKLQPNLLVIKTTKYENGVFIDEMKIINEDSHDKDDKEQVQKNISCVFDYFEIIALKKISENKNTGISFSKGNISIERTSLNFLSDENDREINEKEKDKDKDEEEESPFKELIGGIDVLTSTWKKIVSAFKTTKTVTVKERLEGKGFAQLAATCMSDNMEGLEASMVDEYLADFQNLVLFPKDSSLAQGLANSIKFTKISKQKMFNGNNIIFTKENGGETTFLTFLHRRNTKENTYDFIYSYYKAQFKLEPNIWIMNKGLSVLGGIYENNEDYIKYVPRGISEEDMKAIMSFGQLINMKEIYSQLGFKNLEIPQI